MSERAITIPYACGKDGHRYTALQMSNELYAYKLRWKSFVCPVDGCNRNLKWTHCSVKGKFWSHKQSQNSEVSGFGQVAHSGETWSHITAKAKVVDNLKNICFRAKKCHFCNQFKSYSFKSPSNNAKMEHLILKGIRADVAVFEDKKLIAVISIVKTHSREPEKWQKIYDELGVMLFEIMSDDVLNTDITQIYSKIYVHWGMCQECIVLWEDIKALRKKEPQFVIEDGRHLSELKDKELSKLRHSKGSLKQKIEELLRERGVCFRCCIPCTSQDFCVLCKTNLTSTNCAHCGIKTMTTWRKHCVPCCKIINSTKCKVCKEPTHSNWKEYCYTCFEEKKEKKRKREEEEKLEEERKRREGQMRRREEQNRKWEEYQKRRRREEQMRIKEELDRKWDEEWERLKKERQRLKKERERRQTELKQNLKEKEEKENRVQYFGKTYASEEQFLKAHGVLHFSVSKRFRLTPTPTQQKRKCYYAKKVG